MTQLQKKCDNEFPATGTLYGIIGSSMANFKIRDSSDTADFHLLWSTWGAKDDRW
jgi:hypothetical protein